MRIPIEFWFLFGQYRRNLFLSFALGVCIMSCSDNQGRTDITPADNMSSPQVMEEFYGWNGAEDTLMDPLIVAGDRIVPHILQDISDRSMPKRRYAIGALGNIGDRIAIPVLANIALDIAEVEYIRCDCVQAIAMIDWEEGVRVAGLIARDSEQLGSATSNCLLRVAHEIIEGDHAEWLANLGMARSLEDARVRRHD